MKKVVFLLVILLAVTGAMFAQSAEGIFASIPAADYTKSDDKAIWTFSTTGLKIVNSEGRRDIPIRDMKNLAAVMDPNGSTGFTFAYDTEVNQRSYRIMFNPRDAVVTITITLNGKTLDPATLTKRQFKTVLVEKTVWEVFLNGFFMEDITSLT